MSRLFSGIFAYGQTSPRQQQGQQQQGKIVAQKEPAIQLHREDMPPKAVKGEYIETETGNKVSRRAQILGTQNIILGGKTIIQADCTLRGDLYRTAPPPPTSTTSSSSTQQQQKKQQQQQQQQQPPNTAIVIGRYCILSPHSVLRPPSKPSRGHYSYYPLKLGDHVFVGEGAVVEAATVGSYVHIGAGAIIGRFAILKDGVRVLDGCVVPPGMVVPNFSVVGGRPGRVVAELPEGGMESMDLREAYRAMR